MKTTLLALLFTTLGLCAFSQTVIMRYTPSRDRLEVFESEKEKKEIKIEDRTFDAAYSEIIKAIDNYRRKGFRLVSSYQMVSAELTNGYQFFILSKEE